MPRRCAKRFFSKANIGKYVTLTLVANAFGNSIPTLLTPPEAELGCW
jgi:hypothetical protein